MHLDAAVAAAAGGHAGPSGAAATAGTAVFMRAAVVPQAMPVLEPLLLLLQWSCCKVALTCSAGADAAPSGANVAAASTCAAVHVGTMTLLLLLLLGVVPEFCRSVGHQGGTTPHDFPPATVNGVC